MPENVNAVPARTPHLRRVIHRRRAARGLGGELTLLHGSGGRRGRPAGGVFDRIARQQQFPRWFRSRRRLRRYSGAERLPRLPGVPQRARPQLYPAVALGAVQVAGRRGRLPLLHDAATVAPHRARDGKRRQAEVRPLEVRSGVLRPAARLRHRRRKRGHLRLGYALRRLRAPPQSARPTTSKVIRSMPPTTSTILASPRSTITRCCR